MKRLARIFPVILLLVCFLSTPAQRRASTLTTDDELSLSQRPLRSLAGVIVVASLRDDKELLRGIITKNEIEAYTRDTIKRAGIFAGPKSDIHQEPPLLIIEIEPTRSGTMFFYSLEIRVDEAGTISRKEHLRESPDFITSWATSTVEAVNIRKARASIIDTLMLGVEMFIKDWQKANPKNKH